MPYAVDFNDVSTVGLESSPVAPALAGLRAHEARYFKDKYDHVFTVEPASIATTTMDWVHRILEEERDIVISSRPLEATAFEVENIRIAYVFYESGLVDQRDVHHRRPQEAGGRVQALRRDGSPRGARLAVQVREAEVEAGRNHSWFLLRLRKRLPTAEPRCAPATRLSDPGTRGPPCADTRGPRLEPRAERASPAHITDLRHRGRDSERSGFREHREASRLLRPG